MMETDRSQRLGCKVIWAITIKGAGNRDDITKQGSETLSLQKLEKRREGNKPFPDREARVEGSEPGISFVSGAAERTCREGRENAIEQASGVYPTKGSRKVRSLTAKGSKAETKKIEGEKRVKLKKKHSRTVELSRVLVMTGPIAWRESGEKRKSREKTMKRLIPEGKGSCPDREGKIKGAKEESILGRSVRLLNNTAKRKS